MIWGRSSSQVSKSNVGEEPWEYKAKYPDHYVVYGRKEDPEPYKYPQSGYSRYCWMPIPDDMHKVLVIDDREKHHKNPEDPRYFHWQFFDFPRPLKLTQDPGHWCVPEEMLTYQPSDDVIFKYFFKGTKKEVKIRQVFFHTELRKEEEEWALGLRDYCRWKKFPWRGMADPYLLRIGYYGWRKQKEKYAPFAYQHLLDTYTWRANMFPLTDTDPEILEDLAKGTMYWTARDKELRPLLIVRIQKEERKPKPERFLKLTIFCFEWAVRYLFVPGKVETCTVLFDIQNVGLSDIPLSAIGEMVNALTHEYPFRLDKMWVVHDSVWISTGWACAKQFLTEVQQEKIKFYRKKEILPVVAPFFSKHQIEERYGGNRPAITKFYPFPLLPGPFDPNSTGVNPNAVPDCHEVFTEESSIGRLWINGCRDPLVWSDKANEVFHRCGLRGPNEPPEEPTPVVVDEPRSTTPTIQISPPTSPHMSHPSSGIQTPTTAPPIANIVTGDIGNVVEGGRRAAEVKMNEMEVVNGINEAEQQVGRKPIEPMMEDYTPQQAQERTRELRSPMEPSSLSSALLVAQWSSDSLSSIVSSSSLMSEHRPMSEQHPYYTNHNVDNGKPDFGSEGVSPATAATLQPSEETEEEGFADQYTAPLHEKEGDKESKAATKEPSSPVHSVEDSEKALTEESPALRTPEKRIEPSVVQTPQELLSPEARKARIEPSAVQTPQEPLSPEARKAGLAQEIAEQPKVPETTEQLPKEPVGKKKPKKKRGGGWRLCCPGKKVMESEVRA